MDFEKLYNTYYMEVYSYVMTLLKNAQQAEEITQEVFFKALKAKESFQSKSGEFTWLCAIAKNTCMDVFRKNSKAAALTEDLPSETNVEQMLTDENLTLQIHYVLHNMEEPYKEVFQLRIFGELSFQKIGTIFGKTENWARVTYHRARLKIQEKMNLNDEISQVSCDSRRLKNAGKE